MIKYDVFISYSSHDQKVAEGVCGYMESNGCRCFVAYRDIPRGKVWARAIADAIDHSQIMVVVFSEHFNNSEQTDREIELAAENKMPILTFRIAESEFTGAKKYYLKNLNWIDAFPNPDVCFGKLFESVSKLVMLSDDGPSKKGTIKKSNPADFVNTSPIPNLKIKCDLDCVFYLDNEERLQLKAGQLQKIPLVPGEYELIFVATENPVDRLVQDFEMPQVDKLLKVSLKEIRDKRLEKEAEEKRLAEEKRREEERLRAEEGARKRAKEERNREEDEARKRADEERRRQEDARRKAEEERWLATSDREFTVNGVSFKMIYVEGGTFQMGSNDSDAFTDEEPVHPVMLSSYHIGEVPVTLALWKAVMGNNPSKFDGDDLPTGNVSWDDCQEFLKNLNQLTGKTFRLPTEAEWEYAARGGRYQSPYKYAGSNSIDEVAWYNGNSGDKIHSVKTKKPNALGIYDMSGNVWEWCQDWYGDYCRLAQTDPQGPSTGSSRVLRGGRWGNFAGSCRVFIRLRHTSDYRFYGSGFRLAL